VTSYPVSYYSYYAAWLPARLSKLSCSISPAAGAVAGVAPAANAARLIAALMCNVTNHLVPTMLPACLPAGLRACLPAVLSILTCSTAPTAATVAAAVPAANAGRLIATGSGLLQDPRLISSVSRTGSSGELLKGPLAYVLVLLAATLLAWREQPAGLIAVAMMCGGDGLADIVGRKWGRQLPLPWNNQKSWPGSVAMLLGGVAASMG
jgi:CDP-diglyceride synthetase